MWDAEMGRTCSKKGINKDVLGEDEERKPRSPTSNIGQDSIKMDLKVKTFEGTRWIQLPQDREQQRSVVCKVMKVLVLGLQKRMWQEFGVKLRSFDNL